MLARKLAVEGVETTPLELAPLALEVTHGDPIASRAYLEGDLYVQDQASQAAALVPPPLDGERVLDAAAAPGGKSFAILASAPGARVVAADASAERLAILSQNGRRLRRPLALLVADAARPALGGGFARVIVDLPCSGTGILARHPDLKWRLSETEIGRLAAEASALLDGVAPLVRPGGRLIAITCSIEREENEDLVHRLLERRRELRPVALEETLHGPSATQVRGPGLWRVLPGAHNDGFTVQVLERR